MPTSEALVVRKICKQLYEGIGFCAIFIINGIHSPFMPLTGLQVYHVSFSYSSLSGAFPAQVIDRTIWINS